MSKFKVGDRVLEKKPLYTYRGPAWVESMDQLDSMVLDEDTHPISCFTAMIDAILEGK